MKTIPLLLLFFFLPLVTLPQSAQPRKHVILLKNIKTSHVYNISEKESVSLQLKDGRTLTGPIQSIRSDTIRINDTTLVFAEILQITKKSPQGPWVPNPHRVPLVFYNADTTLWQVVFPPEKIYSSPVVFHNYLVKSEKSLKAQVAASRYPFLYKNFLMFNITKLVHLELAAAYERVLAPKLSWSTEVSYIFGLQNANAYYTINYPLYNYNGFSVTTIPQYFVINSRTYLGLALMYRYLWFTDVRTGWPDKKDCGMLQDQFRNDIGISLRVGSMKRYNKFVVDWYLGWGVKYIMLEQQIYANYLYHDNDQMHWINADHSPVGVYSDFFGVVCNAGIRIGFGF